MNWLNIPLAILDSEEFVGSTPTERGTWLCLQRYCCGQENGGRITDAKSWKCRKWQQIVRVTLKEVTTDCDLWSWDQDDLIVWEYPAEKETEIKTKRENGKRGGRPNKKPRDNHMVSDSETTRLDSAETERNRKGIGKEGEEEKEDSDRPRPPKFDEVAAFAKSANMGISQECVEAFFDEMESVEWTYRGQPCVSRTAWQARFRRFATKWINNERGRDQR